MRVGVVCPYDLGEPGGVQQLCEELAAHLRSSGTDATLIGVGTTRRLGGPGTEDATVRVGRAVKIRANESNVPLTLSPLSWNRMRAALHDVDLVHIHEPMMPLAGWAALKTDKPTVMTFHADAPAWVRGAYARAPFVAQRMRSSVLTAVSEAAKRSIPGGWGEVRITPNAIDVAAYDLPVGRVDHRIAFLGRDDPRKGLDIALVAFRLVHAEHPQAELMVMGADRSDDIPGVRFLGRVTEGEKHRMLASSAIYVAPNSGGESFGIVLAEAMAAGCAVVASDLNAFRAVAGDNAVLFPVGDASALAREMGRLLSDEQERTRLGEAGKEAVKAYDWSRVLDLHLKAYADAVAIRERQ
jgi:phosphatidylinositol alpha-mannosyltransferase